MGQVFVKGVATLPMTPVRKTACKGQAFCNGGTDFATYTGPTYDMGTSFKGGRHTVTIQRVRGRQGPGCTGGARTSNAQVYRDKQSSGLMTVSLSLVLILV